MKQFRISFSHSLSKFCFAFFLVFIAVLLSTITTTAQVASPELVNVLDGRIFGSEEVKNYTLENLVQGDKLYVHVQGTSGNLDPFVALLSTDQVTGTKAGEFNEEVQRAIENNRDPLLVVSKYSNNNFLAWDDDSGGGFSAAFEFTIPKDGDYFLSVLSSPFTQSFGDYQLVVGLNAPQVLSGSTVRKGDSFVIPTSVTDTKNAAAQEVTETIGADEAKKRHRLISFLAEDTLYVYVETLEGDLIPQVILRAYGTKPIRSANIAGSQKQASLEYKFPAESKEYLIEVIAKPGSSGTYRLMVGRNEPTALIGKATPFGEPLLQEPIAASVGIKLQQIANIDQKAENYEAVVSTMITWNDPTLAFRADECQCETKIYTTNDFVSFATDNGIRWPAYTYLNQQNNRWIQDEYVVVNPNGDAVSFERFTTTFQAPDFNFRQFPFDTQTFYIRIDSLFSTDFVTFVESGATEVGSQLGEEEWFVTDYETEIITEPSSTGAETFSYIFRFFASRHLSFYIYRIIVPLILIIIVAWITFFLEDYGKRVDATTANLLLFIAFNFTIAGELPRLGYLTYMDTLLVGAFGISVLIVSYNVYLKRQEKNERQTWAQKIDKYMIWLYPLGYTVSFLVITWYFFWK